MSDDQHNGLMGVDWDAIRRDYETTPVGWTTLACRYGFKSKTSIRRRAQREGWKRDVQAITERLMTRAIAADGQTIDGEYAIGPDACEACVEGVWTGGCTPEKPASGPDSGETVQGGAQYNHNGRAPPAQQGVQGGAQEGGAQSPARGCADLNDSLRAGGNVVVLPVQGKSTSQHFQRHEADAEVVQPGGVFDDDDVSVATGLADLHVRAVREQVRAANRLMNAGEVLIERITTVLNSLDEDKVRDAARRLILNPKTDSLHAMISAATKLIDTAVSIKRRALSMDNLKGGVQPSVEAAGLTPRVRAVLDQMDPKALMSLRNAAVRVARLRPDEVPAGKEAEDDEEE